MNKLYNIFKNIRFSSEEEIEEKIYEDEGIKVIRTMSLDQVTGFYDQEELEIVFLLRGKAQIEYEDGRRLNLGEGDKPSNKTPRDPQGFMAGGGSLALYF